MKINMIRIATAMSVLAFAFNSFAKGPAASTEIGSENQEHYNGAKAHAGQLVIRVLPEFRSHCTPNGIADQRIQNVFTKLQVQEISRKFPRAVNPGGELNRYGRSKKDMTLVYQLRYASGHNLYDAIRLLKSTGVLEYADVLYYHEMSYTPNDPSTGSQYFLGKINAYNAWDVWKGDTNTVVGIVDSGTDWDHPDLQANIKYNWADPIDGIDNDNDGFTDNFRGWDVSDNDNNPMVGSSDHGSHVSGCAAAVTDNGVGVASPGFKCRFLPVKSTRDASTTSIDNGYDGVIYAAEHGAHIINCSWGRTGGPSSFEQDIITYVTYDLDRLVVAASGNNGVETDHYPSSYNEVLSVSSTGTSDAKSGFSNYGFSIDVCAPGSNIYSTVFNNTYVSYSGTSMAAPVAAGCAAMIKSYNPWMNALQVGQQLRVTCDNIYGVGANAPYQNKLGKGRVNLFKALTDSIAPGVIVDSLITNDGNDNVFIIGDTINIQALFLNLLRPTANLVCSLSTTSTDVQILNNTFNGGVINTMDTASNYMAPYRVRILPSAPTNSEVIFRITMTDGSWSDFYSFKITINVDYINIAINDVATSITSKGLIGYNESGQVQGLGFTYMNGPTILYEMGLMIGAAGTQVSDNVRGDASSYDSDFAAVSKVVSQSPGTVSDFDINGTFRDNGTTSTNPLNLLVSHRAMAWTTLADRKYVIVEYNVKNTGSIALNNLYTGLFSDWDIPLYSNNKCATDNTRKMGYVWSTDAGGLWAGMKLLTNLSSFNHYAIDNVTGGGGGVDLSNGNSNAEKYTTLSTFRADAGNTAGTGNDVIDVVSSGPVTLAPGDSVVVAFALIAGEDLLSLQASADAAQIRYDDVILTNIEQGPSGKISSLEACHPNPAREQVSIRFHLADASMTKVRIYDNAGREVKLLLEQTLNPGDYTVIADVRDLPAGAYFYNLESGSFTKTLPLTIVR